MTKQLRDENQCNQQLLVTSQRTVTMLVGVVALRYGVDIAVSDKGINDYITRLTLLMREQ